MGEERASTPESGRLEESSLEDAETRLLLFLDSHLLQPLAPVPRGENLTTIYNTVWKDGRGWASSGRAE